MRLVAATTARAFTASIAARSKENFRERILKQMRSDDVVFVPPRRRRRRRRRKNVGEDVKFKVGDRVKRTGFCAHPAYVGHAAEINGDSAGDYTVVWDEPGPNVRNPITYYSQRFFDKKFELIAKKPNDWEADLELT